MFPPLKFAVRYWSSLLPQGFCAPDEGPAWVDYSLHPASKLGLHNALLARHDRLEILAADGGYFDCAVFLVGGGVSRPLSPAMAEKLFAALPHGRIKWLEIGSGELPAAGGSSAARSGGAGPAVAQLPLFPHAHTPYDDVEDSPGEAVVRHFDIDA